MTEKRVQINKVVKDQLPSYVRDDSPLVGEFLSAYYQGQEYQGGPIDIISNLDSYIQLNKSGNIQYINNVGRRWSLFQQINFSNASQPFYVAMMPSGKILTEPIQYVSEKNFENWLRTSIDESTK